MKIRGLIDEKETSRSGPRVREIYADYLFGDLPNEVSALHTCIFSKIFLLASEIGSPLRKS